MITVRSTCDCVDCRFEFARAADERRALRDEIIRLKGRLRRLLLSFAALHAALAPDSQEEE